MWKRLQPISWAFVLLLWLSSGSVMIQAAQDPARTPPRSAPPPGSDFSKFVGTWVAHGALLTIAEDGSASFEARTYSWCGLYVAQPCDSIQGNQIVDGYREQLLLTDVRASTAYGNVIWSNDPSEQASAAITLTLRADDTLLYYTNSTSFVLLCGPAAPTGTCGA